MTQEQAVKLENAADVMRVLMDFVTTATCERYTDAIRINAAQELCEMSSPNTFKMFENVREVFRSIANARTDNKQR